MCFVGVRQMKKNESQIGDSKLFATELGDPGTERGYSVEHTHVRSGCLAVMAMHPCVCVCVYTLTHAPMLGLAQPPLCLRC